jgi:carboxyl-terminal processing protease
MRNFITTFLLALSLGCGAQDKDHHFDVAKQLDVMNVIYKQLDMMYVDSLRASEVIGNGINAMLRSLDPYTEYYPEEKLKELTFLRTGTYAGIGSIIRYNFEKQRVVINEPYEGMPAAEVGLRKGDIILAIDDSSMTDKKNDYVSERLRGEAGTTFVLKVLRPSTGKTMKFKITRRAIQTPAIPYYGMLHDEVGYISLNSFTEGASKEFRRAFMDLRKQGMRALLFDLRNNGGGSEQEAVNIVNMFVPKGRLVVANKGKMERVNHNYTTTVEPLDSVMPLVVLVNGSSASASEITSGALQDMDRAVILGTRTYGKGLVQMTTDLPYNGSLKLTTSKYYIPSGRCIQAREFRHSRGGYVEHIPDSLTKVFYTRNGREVRDGGGIKPDVEVKPDSMTNIVFSLTELVDSAELVHNFEVDYIAKHPTIAPPSEFELTDADFEEFKQRVLKSKFKYDRSTETYLDELEKIAKFEGYYDDARNEFANLRAKLKHNIEKDLDLNRETLKQVIGNDIVAAYYFQRGGIEHSMRYDKQLKAAIELVNDAQRYRSILK